MNLVKTDPDKKEIVKTDLEKEEIAKTDLEKKVTVKKDLDDINKDFREKILNKIKEVPEKQLNAIQGALRNRRTHELILKFLSQYKEILIEARSLGHSKEQEEILSAFDKFCSNLFKILKKFCEGNTINKT